MNKWVSGEWVHDALNPRSGGAVVYVGKHYLACRPEEGDDLRIPLARVAKGPPQKTPTPLTEEDVIGMEDVIRVCNCAGCGQELLGVSNLGYVFAKFASRERVAGRVDGRPYCYACLAVLPRL